MSLVIAPIEVLTDSRLTDPERRVLLALFSWRGKNTNTVWPGLEAIAERALIKDKTRVSKLTSSLAEKGWLTKKKRGFTGGNQYTLVVPDEVSNLEDPPNLDSDTNLGDEPKLRRDTTSNLDSDTNSNLDSDTKCNEQTNEQTNEQEGRADRPTVIADRVIDHLNRATGKRFKYTKTSRTQVIARLREGFTEHDCIRVIENRAQQWLGTHMDEYLRPSTLFRPSNFEGYLNAKIPDAGSSDGEEAIL